MSSTLPSKQDWDEFVSAMDLDIKCARENWETKSQKEVELLLTERKVEATTLVEDLDYMPPKPFLYYLSALANVLTYELPNFDESALYCLTNDFLTYAPNWILKKRNSDEVLLIKSTFSNLKIKSLSLPTKDQEKLAHRFAEVNKLLYDVI